MYLKTRFYPIKMSQNFPKPYEPFGANINVKVDLSNYATRADLKNISHVDTSSFALKTDLANLKTEADKLDIDKLAPVPVDLSKRSDVVKNDVVYEINKKDSTTSSDPTQENCLFGAVTLTKNVNIDKYGYSGYGIGFDRRSSFSFPGGGFGQNVLIFGADMSSSAHIDNKKKIY